MKKALAVIATSGFLVVSLLVTPNLFAQATGQTTGATTGTTSGMTAPAPGGERGEARERHPEIRKAINKLKAAREDLEKAAHDYAGHRVKAIQAVDLALEELRLALESDRK